MGLKKNTKEISPKELTTFLEYIGQLEPIEFMGVLKIMSVQVLESEKKPRRYEDLLSDLIDRFCGLERKRRRELTKLVRLTIKKSKEEREQAEKQNQSILKKKQKQTEQQQNAQQFAQLMRPALEGAIGNNDGDTAAATLTPTTEGRTSNPVLPLDNLANYTNTTSKNI